MSQKVLVLGASYEQGILRAAIQIESYYHKVPRYRLKILSGAKIVADQGGYYEAKQAINAATKFGLVPQDWVVRSQEVGDQSGNGANS